MDLVTVQCLARFLRFLSMTASANIFKRDNKLQNMFINILANIFKRDSKLQILARKKVRIRKLSSETKKQKPKTKTTATPQTTQQIKKRQFFVPLYFKHPVHLRCMSITD